VLDLASRERKRATIVLNRTKAGTRLGEEVASAAAALDADVAVARLGQRVVFAETLGNGQGAQEPGKSAATTEVQALADEIIARL
jgi:chromosome partitioning protein